MIRNRAETLWLELRRAGMETPGVFDNLSFIRIIAFNLEQAIAEAVLEERQACAKAADELNDKYMAAAKKCDPRDYSQNIKHDGLIDKSIGCEDVAKIIRARGASGAKGVE